MSQQALPNQDPGRRGRPGYYGVPPASAAAAVPAAFPAPAATVSAGLPPGDGPIPLTQGSVVLRRWATPSSAVTTVLMVIVVVSAGVLLLAWGFFRLTSGGDAIDLPRRITVALLPGLPGLLLLAAVPLMLSRRTVLDARGIHVSGVLGTRDHPWPSSRRSFHVRVTSAGLVNLVESAEGGIGCLIGVVMVMAVFLIIKRAKIVMATPEGRAVRLTGLTRVGVSRRRLQAGGAADLDRIWAWAVARGYARETGRYTELRGPRKRLQLQRQRREQERRHGLI
ncbi:hypothetical protein [Actinomyces dentalis]|uniref:hypothetical protein n=1 Tax=Actinomyces dentalis TaxID=272548 RepID=UPI0004156F12|nr:hypothetical protein [Actinomyces dentalis]